MARGGGEACGLEHGVEVTGDNSGGNARETKKKAPKNFQKIVRANTSAMRDVCDVCDGIMFCGRGASCKAGAACQCRCHDFDSRTALEIVETHKQAKPDLDVSPLAGMHRNKLASYFEATMDSAEITRALHINELKPGLDRPSISDDYVPPNVVELMSDTPELEVKYSEGMAHHLREVERRIRSDAVTGHAKKRTLNVSAQATDLLSRSHAMIKSCKSPIAKQRPRTSNKAANAKGKPCKVA